MITHFLNKEEYNILSERRDYYNPNIPITVFCKKIFDARLKHVSYNHDYTYQHILEKFDVSIIFDQESNFKKYQEIINQSGKHYTCFLLRRH